MYEFITHTWNPIKGKCYHDCLYCYMKKWGEQKPIHLDEKELKTDLGNNNFIFVCSGCDMFASDISHEWINRIIEYCKKYNNKYLFQTKNPTRIYDGMLPDNSIICTTIETNRWYFNVMNNAPRPKYRAKSLWLNIKEYKKYITIEPIMDFDINTLLRWVKLCEPIQVNIGADSKGHNLPEPPKEKIFQLIEELEKFTKVHLKKNLNRLIETENGKKRNNITGV